MIEVKCKFNLTFRSFRFSLLLFLSLCLLEFDADQLYGFAFFFFFLSCSPGIIFGVCTYLIVLGIIEESARFFGLIAILTLALYAGVFLHILPAHSTWEAHIAGITHT
jgi:hypothetical protein